MEKKKPPFIYQITRIQDCGLYIEEAINPNQPDSKLGYGMSFVFDVNNSWIQFIIKAEFRTSAGELMASGSVLTRFAIANLKDFIEEGNETNVIFPDNTVETLFGLSFTHLRAILTKNLAGSRFAHLILPVINPIELFKNLLEYNIAMYNNKVVENPTGKVNQNKSNDLPKANNKKTKKSTK